MRCQVTSILAILIAGTCVSAADPVPANDKCDGATTIAPNQTLNNQKIQRTAKDSNEKGEDPKGSLREDVFYTLTITDGPVWVTVTVSQAGTLETTHGIYAGDCDDGDASNMAELASDKDDTVTRCLNTGKYFIAVDESRAAGANEPTSDTFSIEVMTAPWDKGDGSFSIAPDSCPLAIDGFDFKENSHWDVYVIDAGIADGDVIPPRVPGTAHWVMADAFGQLVRSDLELALGETNGPEADIAPATLANTILPGIYDVIIDDGDGIFDPVNDYALLGVDRFEKCFVSTGSCCLDVSGTCVEDVTLAACDQANGSYQGDFSTCDLAKCPSLPMGSCCFSPGDCGELLIEEDCLSAGGSWSEGLTCGEQEQITCVSCSGDCDGDGVVGIGDLLDLLASWGGSGSCDADGDGIIGIFDLLSLLAAWGPCP